MVRSGVRSAATARLPTTAGHAGIALWSFLMTTAHGAGLMLVPALVPLCASDGPVREISASGSLVMALAAVAVHTAAMLLDHRRDRRLACATASRCSRAC